MADFNTDINALLAKSFAGELLQEEAAVLDRWLSEAASNQEYAKEMHRIWQAGGQLVASPAGHSFDTEKALLQVKRRLHRGEKNGTSWRVLPFFMTAAASLALLVTAWLLFGPVQRQETLTALKTPVRDTLSDGTLVTLNRASELRFPSEFNRGARRLRLQGEAFFKVQPDAARVFTVAVRNLEISVLGTAFNVDNLTDTALVNVTVTEGRVRLRTKTQSVIVQAGESVTFRHKDGRISKNDAQDPNFLSYENRQFIFSGTPMRSVIRRLEAVYGAPIAVENPGQLDCLLTARFADLELERVLEIIADSFSFDLEKNGSGFLLKGAACIPK